MAFFPPVLPERCDIQDQVTGLFRALNVPCQLAGQSLQRVPHLGQLFPGQLEQLVTIILPPKQDVRSTWDGAPLGDLIWVPTGTVIGRYQVWSVYDMHRAQANEFRVAVCYYSATNPGPRP